MNLVEWNPLRDFDRQISSLFDRTPLRFFSSSSPRIDVYQTDNDVILKAEIPGVSKDDLNVYIDDNSIRISGQTKKTDEFNDNNVYRAERTFGSFSRTIPLPVEIKSENATADYSDGILTIKVPKMEEEKSRGRKIEIH